LTDGPKRALESAMFTANVEGSGLREVVPFGRGVSHFEWRNDGEILATYRMGSEEKNHYLFPDGAGEHRRIAEDFLVGDGHCSFAPEEDWIATDSNDSQALTKTLKVYSLRRRRGTVLGVFPMNEPRFFTGDLRCDLHPRWNRRGDAIAFDALESGSWTRQLHVAELTFREVTLAL
jgi:dipeptidyl aminopeptidase/acylaminoacyl peptidase